jgi:hypothetical protein
MTNQIAGRQVLLVGQLFLFSLLACVPAQTPRSVDADALKDVALSVPEPADLRDTPGIGCGIVVNDLSLRAHKQLVVSFSNAGAAVNNSDRGPWVLKLALREATMGPENVGPRRTDHPFRQGGPDAPDINTPQASLFNGGNDHAQVVFDATLVRDGEVIWRDTVSGNAQTAPCIQAYDKVREAMGEAVEKIRDQVIKEVRTRSAIVTPAPEPK